MFEQNHFNYTEYIRKRLREIDNLDERRYAKEALLESLGEMFSGGISGQI